MTVINLTLHWGNTCHCEFNSTFGEEKTCEFKKCRIKNCMAVPQAGSPHCFEMFEWMYDTAARRRMNLTDLTGRWDIKFQINFNLQVNKVVILYVCCHGTKLNPQCKTVTAEFPGVPDCCNPGDREDEENTCHCEFRLFVFTPVGMKQSPGILIH